MRRARGAYAEWPEGLGVAVRLSACSHAALGPHRLLLLLQAAAGCDEGLALALPVSPVCVSPGTVLPASNLIRSCWMCRAKLCQPSC